VPQMDAVVIQASGPPAQSLACRSEPVPEPGLGEVLVEVQAAAVNPLDVANAAGAFGTPLPMIPGGDYAGVVSGGEHAGQEVWGSGPALGMALGTKRPGTHARFVALPETWLSRKPDRLTMTEAAAVGRSYFTAWQTVVNVMGLMPGEIILITGGAGMVGQAAAAIARWRGAEPVIADRRRPDGAGHFAEAKSPSVFAVEFGILVFVLVIDVAVFRLANRVSEKLDEGRMLVTEKVFGFLIAAIAVQLVLDGMVQIGVLSSVPHRALG
jgi:NADPH:quinone reductase-like Zn-dependent oxidoreductase